MHDPLYVNFWHLTFPLFLHNLIYNLWSRPKYLPFLTALSDSVFQMFLYICYHYVKPSQNVKKNKKRNPSALPNVPLGHPCTSYLLYFFLPGSCTTYIKSFDISGWSNLSQYHDFDQMKTIDHFVSQHPRGPQYERPKVRRVSIYLAFNTNPIYLQELQKNSIQAF